MAKGGLSRDYPHAGCAVLMELQKQYTLIEQPLVVSDNYQYTYCMCCYRNLLIISGLIVYHLLCVKLTILNKFLN